MLLQLLRSQLALMQDSDLSADAEVVQQQRAEEDREASAALRKMETAGVVSCDNVNQMVQSHLVGHEQVHFVLHSTNVVWCFGSHSYVHIT
jgi:hypothetical protein